MKTQLGNRLKELRLGMHQTQTEVANLLGTQQSSINRYESGQSAPSPDILIRYADYYDVSMDYIYCRTDNPHGKYFDCHPKRLTTQLLNSADIKDFLEMCFDPSSPMNARLKETLFQMFTEEASV